MQSRKSWFNAPLYRNIVKNNVLPAKVSLLLFIGFLILAMVSGGAEPFPILIFMLSSGILTTIYAPMTQRYLTNKQEATYMKTLPVSSLQMWFTQYISGYSIVLGTLLIELLLGYLSNFGTNYLVSDRFYLLKALIVVIVLSFIYYSISFFTVCITGKRIGQFLFILAFYFAPVCLYLGTLEVGNMLTIGYLNSHVTDSAVALFLPLIGGLEFASTGSHALLNGVGGIIDSWPHFYFHIITALVFFIGSYYAYTYRPLEKTEAGILYSKIHCVVRVFITLAMSVLSYIIIYHSSILNYTFVGKSYYINIMLCICIGMVIAFIVEVICKSYHIYKMLLLHLIMICMMIGICIWLGNHSYKMDKQKLLATKEVNCYIEIRQSEEYLSYTESEIWVDLEPQYCEQILTFIENHPDSVYANELEGKSSIYISMTSWQERGTSEYFISIDFYIEEEAFQSFFKENQEVLQILITNIQGDTIGVLGEGQYMIIQSEYQDISLLDSQGIAELLAVETASTYETLWILMGGNEVLYTGYDNNGSYIRLTGSEEIEEIIHREEYKEKLKQKEVVDAYVDTWLSRYMGYENEDVIYYEGEYYGVNTSYHLLSLLDNQYVYEVSIYFDEADDTYEEVFTITCVYRDGEVVLQSIEGGMEYYD